jgi:branched-chain amino acid transport system substrate-binding protein
MVIKEVSYEMSEPTLESQIITLQGSGTDVFVFAATPRAAAQAIRKAYDIGWTPARYMSYVSQSIVSVKKPAGAEKSRGVVTATFIKDPTDSRWMNDPGMKEWRAFCAKYLTPTDFIDGNSVSGFTVAAVLVQVLKQCANDLSRDNIMRQAANLKDLELPMLLLGIKANTSPANCSAIRQMQLATFNSVSWELFGELLTG